MLYASLELLRVVSCACTQGAPVPSDCLSPASALVTPTVETDEQISAKAGPPGEAGRRATKALKAAAERRNGEAQLALTLIV